MKKLRVITIVSVFLLFFPTILFLGFCSDATNTIYKEYKPSTLLKKYEYFKDLSSAIDEKRATIEVYQEELKMYTDPKEYMYQQTHAELIGLISMHNSLCAEYNSAMSKFNYRFCNKGTLPESNLTPLPREYKPFILKIN
jgi:hypothetical protein